MNSSSENGVCSSAAYQGPSSTTRTDRPASASREAVTAPPAPEPTTRTSVSTIRLTTAPSSLRQLVLGEDHERGEQARVLAHHAHGVVLPPAERPSDRVPVGVHAVPEADPGAEAQGLDRHPEPQVLGHRGE